MNKWIFGILLAASFVQAEDKSIIKNGDFKDKLEHWQFRRAQEYRDKMKDPVVIRGKKGEANSFSVALPYASATTYVRLDQEVELVNDQVYRVRCEYRADDSEGPLNLRCGQHANGLPRHLGLSVNFPATKEWQTAEAVFKARDVETSEPMYFRICFGKFEGPVMVRNVSVVEDNSGIDVKRRSGLLVSPGGKVPVATKAPEPDPNDLSLSRTWTSSRGSRLEGKVTSFDGRTVVIQQAEDGKDFRIPLHRLSDGDQKLLKDARATGAL